MKYRFFIFLILIFFSCNKVDNNFLNILKYREKNNIKLLTVTLSAGNIEIKGWANNFIEIESTKNVKNKFSFDARFIKLDFISGEGKLDVTANIPSRIKASVDLKINVPYNLMKVIINSIDCNIKIDDFLGDIEVNNNKGLIDLDFKGSLLRVVSDESIVNLNISSDNSSDVFIKNKTGDINVKVASVRQDSYLDLKSLSGNIYLSIDKNISHKFSLTYKNDIDIKYKFGKIADMKGEYNYLSGFINDYSYKIDISNINGKITMLRAE